MRRNTYRRVKKVAFYLDECQCRKINESYEKEMHRRIEAGGVAAFSTLLRPHPDMNDSYFKDAAC